jgi:Ser/Thr protein kinase RdoA (MazF antagonist)
VTGEHCDFTDDAQLAEAGRRLAQFHVVTATFAEPEQREPSVDPPDYWTEGEAEIARLRQLFAGSAFDKEFAFLRSWTEELRRELPAARRDALPSGWLHTDYHGRNTLFRGDTMVALLDFDDVLRGPFALDIGEALFMFGRPARGSQDIRPEAARLFVESYAGVRPLADGELAAALAYMGMSTAPFVAYYEMMLRNGEDAVARFRRYIQLMRNRRQNAEELRAVLLER